MLNHNPELTMGEFLGQYYEKRQCLSDLAPLFAHTIESGRALVYSTGWTR